jgi:hypothetical protein
MAFTSQDLANINAAIASGELTAKVNDRLITYRSIAELLKAKNVIEAELATQSVGTTPTTGVFRLNFGTSRGY